MKPSNDLRDVLRAFAYIVLFGAVVACWLAGCGAGVDTPTCTQQPCEK